MSTQRIPDFTFTPEKYALHNARPESVDFMWNGMRFTIPGSDMVGPKPAHFEDGEPIPGTLVVQDSYTVETDGHIPVNSAPNWRAKEALINVLGVQQPSGTAESPMAKNGVSFIPVNCPRFQYDRIKEDGFSRYKQSLVQWAMDVVANQETASSKAKEAGVPPKPAGAEYYRAQAILKMHNEQIRKEYGTVEQTMEQESADDEVEFKAFMYATIQKQVEKVAEQQNVDKAKLAEQLMADPEVANKLRKRYSIRRRGFADPVTDPGAEQPPAGE